MMSEIRFEMGLFCPTSSSNLKDSSFTARNDQKKQQILKFKKI